MVANRYLSGLRFAAASAAIPGAAAGTFVQVQANRQRGRPKPMHDATPTADEASDAALLAQVAAGVEPAFIAIYRRHRDDVYRFALAMARSASVAQDVTQEVFLNVLENAARFDAAKGTARAWLLGCARYVMLDRLRLEQRWTDAGHLPEESVPCANEDRVLVEQRLDRLHSAIAALPVEYREALVLCELEELTYAECAAVLECPIGTVRSRLHRARAMLAATLAATEAAALAAPATGAGPAATALKPSEVCS
jgi:RNA polymerase sigma-70 factor, ECF subfamily